MSREKELLKYIDTAGKGIEIAPYFNPLLKKSEGYDVIVLDVVDTETLLNNAQNDPFVPKDQLTQIEPVDIVGDASQILSLAKKHDVFGRVDYIVSSHNFEHLPNPIKFLSGVEQTLKPGGVLSMAVPDCRACFDFFRMPTRLSDWLQAYHEDRKQPTAETVFDQAAYRSVFLSDQGAQPGCHISLDSPEGFKPERLMRECYERYVRQKDQESGYIDSHCSVFFPEILELMLLDLRHLGLLNMEIKEISSTVGHEFFVHLARPRVPVEVEIEACEGYYENRERLLRSISKNLGAAVYMGRKSSISRRMTLLALRTLRTVRHLIASRGKHR